MYGQKKSSSNADEKADTANHQATNSICNERKRFSRTNRTNIEYIPTSSVSSSPSSFTSYAYTHTFVQCRLFIYSFLCCCFFFSRSPFPSLRHDEYNKVSEYVAIYRRVAKKGTKLRYRQLIGHDVEIKWLWRRRQRQRWR